MHLVDWRRLAIFADGAVFRNLDRRTKKRDIGKNVALAGRLCGNLTAG
jgi:hypothetical protein